MAEQQQQLIKAVSQIAETLLQMSSWEGAMPSVLKQLGEAFDVSRAYLFECKNINSDECLSNIVFEWVADGVAPQINNPELQGFSWQENDLLVWRSLLHEGKEVSAHIDELPGHVKEHFVRQDINSLLLIPVMAEENPWGFLGIDECCIEREWAEEEVETMHAVANILGAAIFRHKAERVLRESNERFLLAERAGNLGSWEWNIVTGELVWSDNIEPLFGFSNGGFEKTYDAFLELVHPEDRSKVEEAVSESIQGDQDYHCLHRIICPDGSIRWMEESGEVSRDGEGDPTRMIGVVQDITRDIEVNQALSASEQRFRDLVESTSDWIWEVDKEGRYTYVSPKVEEVLGYRPEELIGKTPFDLMLPGEAKRLAATFGKIVEDRAPISQIINVNLHRDGHQVTLETSGMPILSQEGEIAGYRGIDRDISARVASEYALKESQEIFRQLAEHVSEVFYVRDVAGSFIYISPSSQRLFGRKISVEGWRLDDLTYMLHPEDREKLLAAIETQYQGVGLDREFRIILPGDELKWIWLRTFPIKNEEGGVYRIAGLVEDITARKLDQEVRLEQEREHRNTLIREVHHRIKNNLQSIVGLLRLQLGDYPELKDVLERVMGQVQSIALIHGLQGRSGTMYLCEVFHAIGEANKPFVANKKQLEMEINTMQPLVVREEDLVPVALIINELLTNAIKHSQTEEDKITFKLSAEGGAAVIRIQNVAAEQAGHSQVDVYAEGVGLKMVNALMPSSGAELKLDPGVGSFLAELTLSEPVVRHDQYMERHPEFGVNK